MDKAWKVSAITERVRRTFVYHIGTNGLCSEYLALDEGMLKFEGRRCPIVRAMPHKPITRGLKFFMLVDYETGLLVDFKLDNGEFSKEAFGHSPYAWNYWSGGG